MRGSRGSKKEWFVRQLPYTQLNTPQNRAASPHSLILKLEARRPRPQEGFLHHRAHCQKLL